MVLVDYRIANRQYPGALDAPEKFQTLGTEVPHDVVHPLCKVERSGIFEAIKGMRSSSPPKEEFDDARRCYPTEYYDLMDKKLS